MNVFKCVCVGIVAILLCGCFEGGGEFDAINAGKISAKYKNQTLQIVESADSTMDSVDSALKSALESTIDSTDSTMDSAMESTIDSTDSAMDSTPNSKIAESTPDSTTQNNFILFFFTTSCGVCKAQIPILEQLNTQGIRIYAILGDLSDAKKVNDFTNANKISLPLFYESGAKRFFTSAVGGVKGVPVMAIFKEGKMTEKFIGLTPRGTLLKAI